MKKLFLLLPCAILMGCNESPQPAGNTGVTANRPITAPENRPAGTAPQRETAPDNTAVNTRDRDPAAKTPINQNENKDDVRITADIRKRVVDTRLSVDAQNAKIITQDGRVTLRGPVSTAEERRQIEQIATQVAGEGNVTNELEVKQN